MKPQANMTPKSIELLNCPPETYYYEHPLQPNSNLPKVRPNSPPTNTFYPPPQQDNLYNLPSTPKEYKTHSNLKKRNISSRTATTPGSKPNPQINPRPNAPIYQNNPFPPQNAPIRPNAYFSQNAKFSQPQRAPTELRTPNRPFDPRYGQYNPFPRQNANFSQPQRVPPELRTPNRPFDPRYGQNNQFPPQHAPIHPNANFSQNAKFSQPQRAPPELRTPNAPGRSPPQHDLAFAPQRAMKTAQQSRYPPQPIPTQNISTTLVQPNAPQKDPSHFGGIGHRRPQTALPERCEFEEKTEPFYPNLRPNEPLRAPGFQSAYRAPQYEGRSRLSQTGRGPMQLEIGQPEKWAGPELIGDILAKNRVCADCTSVEPSWLSMNIGCIVCTKCCSAHRSLGTRISRMKSLKLDKIPIKTAETVFGNYVVNEEFEYYVPSDYIKPNEHSSIPDRLRYIAAKYDNQIFRKKPGITRWPPKIADTPPKAETLLDNAGLLSIHLRDAENPGGGCFFLEFSNGQETAKSADVSDSSGKSFSDHLKLKMKTVQSPILVRMFSKGLVYNSLEGEGSLSLDDFPDVVKENFLNGEDVTIVVNFKGKGVSVIYNFQKVEK